MYVVGTEERGGFGGGSGPSVQGVAETRLPRREPIISIVDLSVMLSTFEYLRVHVPRTWIDIRGLSVAATSSDDISNLRLIGDLTLTLT